MSLDTPDKYSEVLKANVILHSNWATHYNTCEPQFRPENVRYVENKLTQLFEATKAEKLLDLGCGTGFIIDIAKPYLHEIHGVDITPAMLAKVNVTGGKAEIQLFQDDTGNYQAKKGYYDLVTAYSFLHHLYDTVPTLETAYDALRPGGRFYADLDPNYYFWQEISTLPDNCQHHAIVQREKDAFTLKDSKIQQQFGVNSETFSTAEYGKHVLGGFREEELKARLERVGFSEINFFYRWYIGQGQIINDETIQENERFTRAEIIDVALQNALPISRSLFKYLGFVAKK